MRNFVCMEALHPPFDLAAIVRARNDFLGGIAALVRSDGAERVQIQHWSYEGFGCARVHLRQARRDVERAPGFAVEWRKPRKLIGFVRWRDQPPAWRRKLDRHQDG